MTRAKQAIKADFAGLDDHIRDVVAPKLAPLEGRRRRSFWTSRIFLFSMLCLVIPIGLHILWNVTQPDWGWAQRILPNVAIWCIGAFATGLIAIIMTQDVRDDAKSILMSGIADHLGWAFEASPDRPAVLNYLKEIDMHWPLKSDMYEDRITGEALRHKFTLTEAVMSCGPGQGRGENRKSFRFRGVVLTVDFPKRVFNTTVLRRLANNLQWRKIRGLKPIGFADPEFSRSYEVFGNDPVEAYYLFSPDIIVTLMDAASDMGGTLAACIFKDGQMSQMIETENKFYVGTTAEAFANDAQFERLKTDVRSVYTMIERVEHYLTHRNPDDFKATL